jgi:hypothetical protein
LVEDKRQPPLVTNGWRPPREAYSEAPPAMASEAAGAGPRRQCLRGRAIPRCCIAALCRGRAIPRRLSGSARGYLDAPAEIGATSASSSPSHMWPLLHPKRSAARQRCSASVVTCSLASFIGFFLYSPLIFYHRSFFLIMHT